MNNAAFPRADLDLAFALRSLIGHLGRLHLGGLLGHALMWLVAQRIGQVCGRMERLVARFRAGKLWTLPGRVVGVKVDEVGPAERVKLERIWPRESAWLVVMGGWKVAAVTGQLEAILATPEMIELLIAAPAARRMLQPFCRALGVPMHLLWPGTFPVAKVVRVPVKRVRAKRQTVAEWVGGRIALPRGVLAWAKREGFGKIPRGSA